MPRPIDPEKLALFLDVFAAIERAPRTSDADRAFCREVRMKYGPRLREARSRERELASIAAPGSFRELATALNARGAG